MTLITINVDETAFVDQLTSANKVATASKQPPVTLSTLIETRIAGLAKASHQNTISQASAASISRIVKVLSQPQATQDQIASMVDALPNS